MSRYRPPAPRTSPYITKEGALALRKELQYLWKTKRPEVTKAVSEAAAQGDRSENAEYIYGKKQLREIDRRIRFLQKRLDVLKVVEHLPADRDKVFFGAWVTVEDEQGKQQKLRIVGPDEFDTRKEYISMDSPLAKALLGKLIDDEVSVKTPAGEKEYLILDVFYEDL
ncbi:MAG: transcription elongation factor GreB [Gammaproteobacteria bacterium]|nr:transcription elongation factor GreB [Gammaproteobacteria bacterium]